MCYTIAMADPIHEINPEPKPESDCPPSKAWVRGVLLLQEKWVFFIVCGLMGGPLGFNELGRRARGVNTTTLSQRMELLEREGIVTKTICSTMPPRTLYELTEAGRGLQQVNEAIAQWSETYLGESAESDETNETSPCCEE